MLLTWGTIQQTGSVSNAPIGTILAWVPKVAQTSSNVMSIPDGWMPCDGSSITQGPWMGGTTPNLNSIGASLRGGSEEQVLEIEDDQIPEHEHYCSASGSARVNRYAAVKDGRESASVSVSCDVGRVQGARYGTKPKNMKVMYIIRVY